ncbi:MAG: hypothetical protein V4532_01375 [Pseudomonadota bacterium]
MTWIKVLNEDKGKTAVHRHTSKKLLEGFQAASGGAQPDDRERGGRFVRALVKLGCWLSLCFAGWDARRIFSGCHANALFDSQVPRPGLQCIPCLNSDEPARF